MSAAIYYHPEAFTTAGPRLMGRNAAGESFLRGFLSHSSAREFWVQVTKREHAQQFAATLNAAGKRLCAVNVIDKSAIGALGQVGALYLPGPGLGEHAWVRTAHGDGAWSLCGITHTTSSARAMDSIAELIAAPVQPWDALICTSRAVKINVEKVLQAQVDYLQRRLEVAKVVLPQLPVIPLGIHTQDFAFTAEQTLLARQALGADPATHVVLFMGRLSFHAKAHPLAMYQALEQAACALPSGERIVLLECGWHANEAIARSYADAAALACPHVRIVKLDGRNACDRRKAWAAADVFCSLSDNIQETFGITPIEAMAAGLPVVVSDWDGYKDTVRDGIDGFRVPTLMPGRGLATDLASRHALEIDTYDMYCGHVCSLVAVDISVASRAFSRLFGSPELRRRMGEAGRQRAREVYDWAAIIPQYESLWAKLGEIRAAQSPNPKRLLHPWPARMDPFDAFASYSTQTLTSQTRLALAHASLAEAMAHMHAYRALAMVDFAEAVLPSTEEVEAVLTAASGGARTAAELVQSVSPARQSFVFRSLAWLLKLGVLEAGR